jgi:hypothetical protein
MSTRWPQKLEIASIVMVLIGVALILQFQPGKFSWIGLIFGFTATFLSANATIFSGKSRQMLLASEAMISKQMGKLFLLLWD